MICHFTWQRPMILQFVVGNLQTRTPLPQMSFLSYFFAIVLVWCRWALVTLPVTAAFIRTVYCRSQWVMCRSTTSFRYLQVDCKFREPVQRCGRWKFLGSNYAERKCFGHSTHLCIITRVLLLVSLRPRTSDVQFHADGILWRLCDYITFPDHL